MRTESARAQRWHDTDHSLHGATLRSAPKMDAPDFVVAVCDCGRYVSPRGSAREALKAHGAHAAALRQHEWMSSCWCCCEICDPDWNPEGRNNPFWSRAQDELTTPA